ncbi:MAG: hypothetical protein ACRBK7_19875 [Acidimicrobiales bacterium]
MSDLEEVGTRDGWRCWLCDQPVDREMPSHDSRGASIDSRITKARAKKKKGKSAPLPERLAHIGCNTGKGANEPVVPWPDDLFVIDPVAIIPTADRLQRKGGREIMARCPTEDDAERTATWLLDRLSRLHPDLALTSQIDEGGGQYMVSLTTN